MIAQPQQFGMTRLNVGDGTTTVSASLANHRTVNLKAVQLTSTN